MKRYSFLTFLCAAACLAQQVNVQEHVLDNGMRILLLPRRGTGNIAAGWLARVGSVNERPGITGISHLFEHMMFKGTTTIGSKDPELDAKLNLQLDQTKAEIRKEEASLLRRARLGGIEDPKHPDSRSPRHKQLLQELDKLVKAQRDNIVKDEFTRMYTAQGASGLNAGTSEDFTIYFINTPTNKLELWFWLESDRLLNPVFREFYSERDVVHEERRMRYDSTPTGRFLEQFDAMFWKSSPYGWPVIGWPSDLESITREDANSYFAVNYAPNNISVALVGDFEPPTALELAKKYFGRLQRSRSEPETVRTTEAPQQGEQRMTAYAETTPEVRIRYHTVPDGHKDEPALLILSGILNGNTGRLFRSLITGQQLATAASAGQEGRKYEGLFEFRGVARQGRKPEDVEQAIYKELEKLQNERVSERELQKVKNNVVANRFRSLTSDFGLMFNILINDGNRGWQVMNTDPPLYQAVTAEDVQRVAKKYFGPDNRNVLLFYRKEAAAKAAAGGAQ